MDLSIYFIYSNITPVGLWSHEDAKISQTCSRALGWAEVCFEEIISLETYNVVAGQLSFILGWRSEQDDCYYRIT